MLWGRGRGRGRSRERGRRRGWGRGREVIYYGPGTNYADFQQKISIELKKVRWASESQIVQLPNLWTPWACMTFIHLVMHWPRHTFFGVNCIDHVPYTSYLQMLTICGILYFRGIFKFAEIVLVFFCIWTPNLSLDNEAFEVLEFSFS